MWLFFLLCFLTVFMAGVFPNNSSNNVKRYTVCMFFAFGILMCLRNTSVGNDTIEYIKNYNLVAQYGSFAAATQYSRFEVGYLLYVRILTCISDDPQLLLIVTGIITSYSFGRFFYRYSRIPWLSVLMFLTLDFFDICMSSTRLSLAIAFLLFAFDGLVEKKATKTILFTILATLFHSSAVFFFLLYPFAMRKKTKKFYIATIVSGIIIYVLFDRLIPVLSRLMPQYAHYLTNSTSGYTAGATLAVGLMLLLWLLMYLISSRAVTALGGAEEVQYTGFNRKWDQYSDRLESVCQLAVWFGIIALFLALQGTMLTRFKYIFAAPILIYYPNSIARISIRRNKLSLLFLSSIVLIAYTVVILMFRPEWGSTYPYSFFWQ